MRQPRLNALRTFAAAGQRLSFSLAAADLNVTQAAVSQQIRSLETDLGQALFHRSHRAIALTDVGKDYLKVVQKALQQLDDATSNLFGSANRQIVVIRCTSSIATQWLSPQIQDFTTAHPDIDLHIRTLDSEIADAPRQDSDIEIFVSGNKTHGPDVTTLLDAVVVPVASPVMFAGKTLKHASGIRAFNLIHVIGYDENWHKWFEVYDPKPEAIPRGLSADSSLFAVDAALRGDGVLLGRRPFIDKYLASGELVEIFDTPLYLHSKYYMRLQKKRKHNAGVQVVAGWLSKLACRKSTDA